MSQQAYAGPLQETIAELGISYPVAEDSDRDTWDAYGMRVYPSWAFIDANGVLVDRSAGKATVERVQELIAQSVGN